MAVVLASSADASQHLCSYLPSRLPAIITDPQERLDTKSMLQQLFDGQSLRTFHLVEGVEPSMSTKGEVTLGPMSAHPMSCDDLIELCEASRSTYSTSSFLDHRGLADLDLISGRLSSTFSSFYCLALCFSDNPMGVCEGLAIPHSTIYRTRLHNALETVHALGSNASNLVFDSMWKSLEPLFESPFDTSKLRPGIFQTFPSDRKGSCVSGVVCCAIHALTSFVPNAGRETWAMVWSTLVHGKAYGKQRSTKPRLSLTSWLEVLDAFEQESALRMAKRLIRAIGARTCLEETLSACDTEYAKPDPRLGEWRIKRRIKESIADFLVHEEQSIRRALFKTESRDEIRNGGELVGTTSLIWLEWLRKCFLKEWDGSLQINRWSVAGSALELIEDLWKHHGRTQLDIPAKLLTIPAVFEYLDVDKAAQDWLSYKSDPNIRHLLSFKFLFDTRAIISLVRSSHHILMRRAYNEADAVLHLRRRTTLQSTLQDIVYLDQRLKTAQDHYLVLKISRQSVLSDAFDQLWHRERRELLRPLRVRMGIDEGEIGHDLGGVQIEFFKLACQELFDPNYSLFSIDPQTRLAWFQPATMIPLYKYQIVGLLFALAIYNGITLPVSLPLAFYKKLLFQQPNEADFREGWPNLAESLRFLQTYQGSVEDDLARDYVYSFDANGLNLDVCMNDPWDGWSLSDKIKLGTSMGLGRLKVMSQNPDRYHPPYLSGGQSLIDNVHPQLPLNGTPSEMEDSHLQNRPDFSSSDARVSRQGRFEWPGWKVEVAEPGEAVQPVTNDNRHDYISTYRKWVMDWSIRPQFNAFAKGFYSVMNLRPLTLLNADQFRNLVEGYNHLDINALQQAATYNHYTATSPVVCWFWEVAKAYPQEKQKQLLEFVTASSRVPVNGAASLTFIIERSDAETSALPGSSTCFGTLRLPEYESKEILASKLNIALEHSLGFGQA
ncbi:hypothetical protein E4T39_06156 [Aureobasidium subglaciale]|nr:hypothetical protein E4T39_06156 [Aureobasidium subglaciale]